MAQAIKVAILGAGRPGVRHAEGYKAAGGFQVVAVADLIPQRRKAIMTGFGAGREVAEATEIVSDPGIDAVSICLPNHLHLPVALAALKAKKHVLCETPPVLTPAEARRLIGAAAKSERVLLYAAQRRWGASEQAAKQALDKGYAGDVYHARAAWTRTRAVPAGAGSGSSGWYTDPAKSGGGVLMDLGLQMLDLTWDLLGQPRPLTAFATTSDRFTAANGAGPGSAVEDTVSALMRFESGKTLEMSVAWAINQPPQQNGTTLRLHGSEGAVDVYTRQGPVLYRNFSATGEAKQTLMKLPKLVQYPAMIRHFRDCILGRATPLVGPEVGLTLMQMVDAIYRSAESGKSADVRVEAKSVEQEET